MIRDKTQNLERLKAQRNELNAKVRLIREELTQLHEPGSYVGEVVKPMGKQKILVKVNPEGKYVVDLDKDIDINKCTPNTRVALRSDSYTLHKILPTKVDPLVSLMKVRTYPTLRAKHFRTFTYGVDFCAHHPYVQIYFKTYSSMKMKARQIYLYLT